MWWAIMRIVLSIPIGGVRVNRERFHYLASGQCKRTVTVFIPPDYTTSVSYVLTAIDARALTVTICPRIVFSQ